MAYHRADKVHLGFEVGTSKAVEIPIRHMVVSGQTQESGKTTTMEALITRSGLRAITFVTKRGEKSFAGAKRIPPYFRERADWVFVSSLIDATMGEKNKLIRSWLMKACRGTKTLAEVHKNIKAGMKNSKGFSESIYTEIDGYLDLVVPQIAELPPSRKIELGGGVNAVDLSSYSTEMQGLVIRSMIEHVYTHEEGVVTVIPEAWEFLPEGRGSPVKLAAQELIRKGAALGNYMWNDSQDLAGVWKLAVRASAVLLIGVQREANEIKRTLDNIPASIAKPTKAQIATLQIGQFYACWGSHAIKTYVQPAWMNEAAAREIAMGLAEVVTYQGARALMPSLKSFKKAGLTVTTQRHVSADESQDSTDEEGMAKEDIEAIKNSLATLTNMLGKTINLAVPNEGVTERARAAPVHEEANGQLSESLWAQIKARLVEEAPALVKLAVEQPEIQIKIERPVVDMDGKTPQGRVAQLIKANFFDEAIKPGAVINKFKQTGAEIHPARLSTILGEYVAWGFLTREGPMYKSVAAMKSNIKEKR